MGKLAEIKTKETTSSVDEFINAVSDEQKRKDSYQLIKLMENATKDKAKMWGSSIVGFGNVRYKSPKTNREVDWLKIGFSPRKASISLYLNINFKTHEALIGKLGKHKTGVGCLYINTLEDVNIKVLEELIKSGSKK